MKSVKIAYGVITRNLDLLSPYINFLINAQKNDHKITSVVLGYKDFVNNQIISKLNEYCEINTVKLGKSSFLYDELKKFDLEKDEIEAIIGTPCLEKYNLVSYGTARNYVLLTALLKGIDILIFFDTDVYPQILFEDGESQFHYEEIDFVTSHLEILNSNPQVVVTTSDYTGYYIIPQMNFPHLDDLLFGMHKETSFEYISLENKFILKHDHKRNIHPTQKVLGGNLAIDLRKIHLLAPFFSTTLILNNECFLGRGEDTLFGPLITKYSGKCIDIDVPIFHDCFGNFPQKPDINNKNNLDRFFYACMGWLIRNPFYNWLHSEFIHDFPKVDIDQRYKAIVTGSQAAAEYFNDKRFLVLPETFKKAYAELDYSIKKFLSLMKAWDKLKQKFH